MWLVFLLIVLTIFVTIQCLIFRNVLLDEGDVFTVLTKKVRSTALMIICCNFIRTGIMVLSFPYNKPLRELGSNAAT